jgi:hypothetical protein
MQERSYEDEVFSPELLCLLCPLSFVRKRISLAIAAEPKLLRESNARTSRRDIVLRRGMVIESSPAFAELYPSSSASSSVGIASGGGTTEHCSDEETMRETRSAMSLA